MTVPFNLIDLLMFICLPTALEILAKPISSDVTSTLAMNETQVAENVTELTVNWLMVTFDAVYKRLSELFNLS